MQVLCLEARVLGLGPRFMSIYIHKLAVSTCVNPGSVNLLASFIDELIKFDLNYAIWSQVERRIYYDEVDGFIVEWLEATTTLVLSRSIKKRYNRKGSPGKCRAIEDVALIVSPCDSKLSLSFSAQKDNSNENGGCESERDLSAPGIEPAVFPLTVRLLSTIPVVLHAVGGDNGPVDIGARLYVSSYLGSS